MPTVAVELTERPSLMVSTNRSLRPMPFTFSSCALSSCSIIWPHSQPATTVIWFFVSVPVLSEQMLVALPMVSQAASTRMKLLSASIFRVEYAREMVTASGSPSGTATTMIVMQMMNEWMIQSVRSRACSRTSSGLAYHMTIIMIIVARPAPAPILPMNFAMSSSFSWSGVSSGSVARRALMRPHREESPTAMTSALHLPAVIWQPESRKGSLSAFFLMSSGSPVKLLSLLSTSSPLMKMQSAGILSPSSKSSTSPT
mmetsp:Transcript_160839/g.390720  ORF Transcript_160839/g.390720 Transcript_160839/m.390720 type:complete len:257 (-) Transcript_160839:527-1297(-)